MTPSKLQPQRLSHVGSPEEQHLLLSAISDAPSVGLRASLLAQLGLEVPPGGDLPSQTQPAPVAECAQPSSVPVAATATNPFTSWVAWVGIAAVAMGIGYGTGALSKGFAAPNVAQKFAPKVATVTTSDNLKAPPTHIPETTGAVPPQGANERPSSALTGSAVQPEAAATLPLPPPIAPALRTKQLAPPAPAPNLEITLIDAARAALRTGDPAGCVAKLLERKRKIRGGMLEPEASLLLVQAMLAQGQTARAREAGERFLKAQPNGAIAERMRFDLAHAGPEPNLEPAP